MKLKLFGAATLGAVMGATCTCYSILKFLTKHERIREWLLNGVADEIYQALFGETTTTSRYSRKGRRYYEEI